ncbi:hypothetical protein N7462_006552 [Penicillium macrosclerotiorum]|uniref:uncharacterized protein n=1 Tax=Penicillium macrosclerotiorum TaxID=303699 RepID=UPI0025496ECD|nr:uncharacterized protein N7462_006552 [Penicillium macrosclerotiorum]KAJ5683387.1 hypothetical protein N7462_006552 [Penicillium macrosclerotiorum]
MSIKTVAIAGGSGSLGGPIIKDLVSSGFEVTALIRLESASKPTSFPSAVKQVTVDYESHDSLVSALQGIDAVVSLLNGRGLDFQPAILDACIEAGVSRFLPSEFGANTDVPRTAGIPIFQGKVAFQESLKEKVAQHPGLSYSLIFHGPLFDFCLAGGLFCDNQNKHMVLYDGGNNRFSTTCLSDLGTVVVGVLTHPEETKNRVICVEGANLTQRELLAIIEKVTGTKWTTEDAKIIDLEKAMQAELAREEPNPAVFIPGFLKVYIYGGPAYGPNLRESAPTIDNDIVGLRAYTQEKLEEKIKAILG